MGGGVKVSKRSVVNGRAGSELLNPVPVLVDVTQFVDLALKEDVRVFGWGAVHGGFVVHDNKRSGVERENGSDSSDAFAVVEFLGDDAGVRSGWKSWEDLGGDFGVEVGCARVVFGEGGYEERVIVIIIPPFPHLVKRNALVVVEFADVCTIRVDGRGRNVF